MTSFFSGETDKQDIYYKKVPDVFKIGLVSPFYKNKDEKNDSKNYRGIIVLPVILKVIEYILRKDLRDVTDPQ